MNPLIDIGLFVVVIVGIAMMIDIVRNSGPIWRK